MRIYKQILFQGAETEIIENALIDTGAEISMIPKGLANSIGAWHTNQNMDIIGVHNHKRTLPIGIANIYFSSLDDVGGQFSIAISDLEEEPLIGMDIMRPLGININTRTHKVTVNNETWEAFKTLSGIIVGGFIVVKALDAIFKEEDKQKLHS